MNKSGEMEPTVIHNFYRATQSLREAMESDLPLNDLERISLENYIALLQMTYNRVEKKELSTAGL
jgi:hypothetical protein